MARAEYVFNPAPSPKMCTVEHSKLTFVIELHTLSANFASIQSRAQSLFVRELFLNFCLSLHTLKKIFFL